MIFRGHLEKDRYRFFQDNFAGCPGKSRLHPGLVFLQNFGVHVNPGREKSSFRTHELRLFHITLLSSRRKETDTG